MLKHIGRDLSPTASRRALNLVRKPILYRALHHCSTVVTYGKPFGRVQAGKVRFMTLGAAVPNLARRPWAFAAVCVMIASLTLLVFGLSQMPAIQLLPWYVVAYLLIGACIFVPTGRLPSLRQAAAFLLPGALLVVLALLNLGLWAGGWLLGLPAWGLLLSRWTPASPLPVLQVLKFLCLLVLGLLIFTFNVIRKVQETTACEALSMKCHRTWSQMHSAVAIRSSNNVQQMRVSPWPFIQVARAPFLTQTWSNAVERHPGRSPVDL